MKGERRRAAGFAPNEKNRPWAGNVVTGRARIVERERAGGIEKQAAILFLAFTERAD